MDRPLKILSFLPHHGTSMSGGERSFIEILKRWAEWGNQIHIITTREGSSILKRQGLKFLPRVYDFPETTSALSWYWCVERAIRKIPREDFDFVYSNEPYTSVLPAFAAKRRTKAPLVIVFKLLEQHEGDFTSCYRHHRRQLTAIGSLAESLGVSVRNILARRADLLLVVSDFYKELLTEMQIAKPARIHAIRHGVNFSHIPSIKVNGEKDFDACFMGALMPRKGIFDLIWAWKRVVDEKPNAKLAIIGVGEESVVRKLNLLISKLDLGQNIIRTGWLDDEKYKIMKRSRVFVFPSYGEGFALAICEAMACGLPVVAYNLAAYEGIYKKGIKTVPTGNVDALAKAATTILEDEGMLRSMSMDAIEQAREYDWDDSARAQLNIIIHFLQIVK